MCIRKSFLTASIFAVALVAAPRTASADWTFTPFLGWNFGGSADVNDSRGSTVWTYDSVTNAVNFEPMFVPEPGHTLTITYYVTCF